MYAKIFSQIFDSSIANNWKTRHVFEDMLKLADVNGVVDMTREAIAARTRLPLEMVCEAIVELESPDPQSRTAEAGGRRIERLDDHRDWGWEIINYLHFRNMASEEQRRELTKLRTRKWRKSKDLETGDAPVTHCDAGDAKQKQREKQIAEEEENTEVQKKRESVATAPPTRFNPDIKIVFDEWNGQKVLPQCLVVSDSRRRKLMSRLQDPFFTENWKAALQKAVGSSFCRGESERGWKATFDWFIQPESCLKLMEGKYDNGKPKGGPAEQKQRQENLTAPRL
jgi:hypothetical protein